MIAFVINPASVIRTLSMALELAVNGVNKHQWRTALICRSIADALGIRPTEQPPLLSAALLHDIGAASDMEERAKLTDPTQEKAYGLKIHIHADEGYRLLDSAFCFKNIAPFILHHHDRWDGGNPSGCAGPDIPLESRIIHLADRIEVYIDNARPILDQADSLRAIISRESGKRFDPDLVDAFLKCSRAESFWLDLINASCSDSFIRYIDAWGIHSYSSDELLNIAELFATIIDRMSIFTATHSRSVAGVAVLLASHHGFCTNELYMMQVAGLLHDLGKLSVPNAILEKPGPLTPEEMRLMRRHTYYTYRILEQIENMDTIARWAAFHHETLDGEGYPFKIQARALPLGSRIMSVADIFVALAEERPYRKPMPRAGLIKTMSGMAEAGKIDAGVLGCLFDFYDEAQAIVDGLGGDPGKGFKAALA